MRWPALFLVVALTCLRAQDAVDWPEVATHGEKPAGLSLTISVPKDHFYEGEVIPVTFTFTNTSSAPFYLWIGNYDRSGRIPDIKLAGRDAAGKPVPDPLAWYFRMGGGRGGGLGNFQDLNRSITQAANQWLRFDQPGAYTIVAWSNRPQKGEKDAARGKSLAAERVELASNPLHITIDPLPAEQAAKIVADCHAALEAGKDANITASTPTTERASIEARREAATKCFTTLRYLETPAARAELRQLLSWPNSFDAAAGLLGAPDPAAEAPLLLDDVRADRLKVDAETIWLYSTLKSYPGPDITPGMDQATLRAAFKKSGEAQRAARDEILAAAKSAGGKNGGTNVDAIWAAFQTSSSAAAWADVVKHQLEFPPEIQRQLLMMMANGQPDNRFPPSDLLPLLRREAPPPNYNREALTALAKVRPDEAKKLIVADVASGTFRYRKNEQGYRDSSKALLALPPGPVPELQEPLRKQLAGDADLEIVFEMVDRYGSPALLPDMLRAYQPHAGRWECEIQGAALRFWIRCDEKAGMDALRKALQSRKETGCYHRVLQDVFGPQWTAAAQPLVLESLHDPDKAVVNSALEVLEKHGDPSCADALVAAATGGSNRGFAIDLLHDTRWKWTAAQREALQKATTAP